MKVRTLIELLRHQTPEANVVVCDRTEHVRIGQIRPLGLAELHEVQLGEVAEETGDWLCELSERSSVCDDPVPGLLIGVHPSWTSSWS